MWTIPNAVNVHQGGPFIHSNNVFIMLGLVLVDILNVYFDCECNHDSQTHICNSAVFMTGLGEQNFLHLIMFIPHDDKPILIFWCNQPFHHIKTAL